MAKKIIAKISRPGYDVKLAADENIVWGSDFKTLKIYRVIKFEATGSEAHGLDYPPTYIYWTQPAYSNEWVMDDADTAPLYTKSVYVDSENVHCWTADDVYVMLFIDPLNE